jgi:hypothetical protein
MICEDPEDALVFGFSLVVPLGDKRKRSRDNDSEPAQRESGHGMKSQLPQRRPAFGFAAN